MYSYLASTHVSSNLSSVLQSVYFFILFTTHFYFTIYSSCALWSSYFYYKKISRQ